MASDGITTWDGGLNLIPILGPCPYSSPLSRSHPNACQHHKAGPELRILQSLIWWHQVSWAHSDFLCRGCLAPAQSRWEQLSEGSPSPNFPPLCTHTAWVPALPRSSSSVQSQRLCLWEGATDGAIFDIGVHFGIWESWCFVLFDPRLHFLSTYLYWPSSGWLCY